MKGFQPQTSKNQKYREKNVQKWTLNPERPRKPQTSDNGPGPDQKYGETAILV